MHPIFALGLPHGTEWIWILLIFLLLFGANKLPQLARGLGKSLGEFRKAKDEFEKELHSTVGEDEAKKAEAARAAETARLTAPGSSVPTSESTRPS